jgi:hypothetical protein
MVCGEGLPSLHTDKIFNLSYVTYQPVAIASGFGFYAIIVKLIS